MSDPPLPYARQAEEAALGAILIDSDAFLEISNLLTAEDFYLTRNRRVWQAMAALNECRCPIDILTVSAELEAANQLEEAGGPAYLMELINHTPTSLNAEAYARLVADAAARRRLIAAAGRIAHLGYDETTPLAESLQQAEQLLLAAVDRHNQHNITPLKDVVSRVYDQLQQAMQSGQAFLGLPSGLAGLDDLLKGFQKGNLVVLAGRPGMGKTSFLLTVARHVGLELRKRVAIFSLEMSEDEVGSRFLAQESGIDGQRLKTGQLQADEFDRFVGAVASLDQAPILVNDSPNLTPAQLRASCKRLQAQHGLDLVIVDYLQLMPGGGRFENRQVEVSHISRQLKALAKELNVPILAAAQLSRAVEQRAEKRPQLSDLRESGGIEQDADVVLLLYRRELQPAAGPVEVSLEVAKQRSGSTGLLAFVFHPAITRFENP